VVSCWWRDDRKTLPKVATEMALHVLAYNLTRVMNIIGTKPLMAALRA
jgi:transposase